MLAEFWPVGLGLLASFQTVVPHLCRVPWISFSPPPHTWRRLYGGWCRAQSWRPRKRRGNDVVGQVLSVL
jgi:hypothetical protein